ncbi:MAG: helix-turn-helix transcriptional regulator [Methanosarcinaceae archaeon]|nr:helix-turn-helix transcriptional regulator [Methanosarcinaceae archaeon]
MKNCTVYKTMNIVGKRWTIPILLELYKGEKREKHFNELKRKVVGITPKILSVRLVELQTEGLVEKYVGSSVLPERSNYFLTESGEDFVKVIQEIKKWGTKWKFENSECDRSLCRYCDI